MNLKVEVAVEDEQRSVSANALPSVSLPQILKIDSTEIVEQLAEHIQALGAVFERTDVGGERFEVQTISFSFKFNVEGKLQLVAGIAAGSGSAITVTLGKPSQHDSD